VAKEEWYRRPLCSGPWVGDDRASVSLDALLAMSTTPMTGNDLPYPAGVATLESARLRLLPLAPTLADAAFIDDLLNQPDWLRYIGDRGVHGIADALDFIRNGPLAMYRQHGCGLLRLELSDSGTSIGMCGLLQRDWLDAPDIGFALLPQFAGRGLAAEAAAAVLQHAFRVRRLPRILAIVQPDNARSLRLLDGLGFRAERQVQTPEGIWLDLLECAAPRAGQRPSLNPAGSDPGGAAEAVRFTGRTCPDTPAA
jgi:ribosomal-protein-alanine N-acetyltransferase